MALRWKNKPPETGLRSIGAPPSGSRLRDGDEEYASTYAFHHRHQHAGKWYWTARNDALGVPLENTCNEPVADEAAAKAAAMAYVRACLNSASQPTKGGSNA